MGSKIDATLLRVPVLIVIINIVLKTSLSTDPTGGLGAAQGSVIILYVINNNTAEHVRLLPLASRLTRTALTITAQLYLLLLPASVFRLSLW